MRFIRFFLEISWQTILIATITGFLSGGGNAVLISLINRAVNQAALPNALYYFIGLTIFTLLTSVVSQFMLINLSQNAIYQLRLRLSKNILSSPLHHLEKLGNNRLLATLTDDIRVLSHAVSTIPNICIDLATVVGCLAYLSWLSNSLFVLAIFFTSIAIACIQTRLNKARHLFATAREEDDNLFKHFQAITTGIKELKLHKSRREDFLSKKLQGSAAKLHQKNSKAMKSFAVANGIGQFSQFTSLGFVLFVLPWFMYIPMPMLSTYVLTSTFIALPMQNLLTRLPDLMCGNIALQKIERMKLSLTNQAEFDNVDSEISNSCQLELDEVTYLYQPNKEENEFHLPQPHFNRNQPMHSLDIAEKGFLLGPISLSFQSGEITYIVGGNGSGKSTLAKLIAGLYTPHGGSIYLNQAPITDRNREWYRQHFSAIFSDFYLFDRCLGFNHANLDREVEGYLKQLQLDRKVQVKNGILSTTRLSQGQRKRLALLTAYLEDRPIYLFDEWASDQDPYFRELFYKEILSKLKERGKTVLVITHDDRYFHLADRIVKLDYGKVEANYTPIANLRSKPLV
ncbi:cyclic peptide export ABC transporter [Gloeocapsopsis dulcis]|uniref:ABC transporter ATP-binding protein n=1 Tax=Gloeocapsopsis dulcis AAB1 = 1H9 TaxID=1433147 RepID=A0A6N8FX34_9CHRO|nr:cyclic peptide export ABC transporter [Gloeocapsopsis dulcis]MUL37182.1 ABC transporter ATP-binding protein [Gloeocapsopsis dulcis AAB1 = 1H9]WNN90211.1 cyclic peptide export ABC transporter [Gloeocapsopsis dulcis]